MSKPSDLSWISRLTSRRAATPRAPEPADLGTAFGMEVWLDSPAAAEATAPAPKPAEPRGWRARRRSRSPCRPRRRLHQQRPGARTA